MIIKCGVTGGTGPGFREACTFFQSVLMLSACQKKFTQFISECLNVIRMCDENLSFFSCGSSLLEMMLMMLVHKVGW